MRVAVNRLFVAVLIALPALILGAQLGNDVQCSSNEDDILAGATVGLIVTNAALMVVFAAGAPTGGPLIGQLTLALVAATTSATLISGGFWIGVAMNEDYYPCEPAPAYWFVTLWGLTAGVMALAGIVAWGMTRVGVRVMTR